MYSDNQVKVRLLMKGRCVVHGHRPALKKHACFLCSPSGSCLPLARAVQVRLAAAAAEDAKQALALTPQYDLAHHLMGRWHYGETVLQPM
jgi:hypothetical protein